MLKRIFELIDRWIWPFIIPTVVVIYLLTSSLAVSAILPSLKAAVPALRSATWLYQHESRLPHNGLRTASLFLMYVATGIWKAAYTAMFSMLGLGVAAVQFGARPEIPRIEALLITMTLCIGATCIVGLAATAAAWKSQVKLWVHPGIFAWCGGDFQRINHLGAYAARFNHATFVLGTSLALPGLCAGATVLAGLTATGAPMDEATTALSLKIMLVAFVVYPIGVIMFYSYLSRRILAASPEQCWDTDAVANKENLKETVLFPDQW